MSRAMRLCLVGCVVLVSLAGCGRYFFGSREPWRKEAEIACLKSGALRENATLLRVEPINGPGMCGADFPIKVTALGEVDAALGYSGELRPPGAIPDAGARLPSQLRSVAPAGAASQPRYDNSYGGNPYGGSSRAPISGAPLAAPAQLAPPPASSSYPPAQSVPLSSRGSPVAAVGPVEIKPAATLACPIVLALDRWIVDTVQPAAQRWFNQPVTEIRQISAYSCRGMNGQTTTRISEHAFGNAIDISSFVLADGRRITVKEGWRGSPEEQGFMRDVQGAACEQFSTVLAPGSNRFHYDHIHLDLMRRASGRTICNPDAMPGEVAAARAAQERGYAMGRDPGVTGSLKAAQPRPKLKAFVAPREDDEDWIEDDGPRRRDY
jgi:hypothetical protein